jgi:hypothetical protein
MKPVDNQLDRLLKAAAQAPRPTVGDPPLGLETRALAYWRAALRNDSGEFLVTWFRRATVFATVLAVASLAWNYRGANDRSSAEMVADSAMGMGIEP